MLKFKPLYYSVLLLGCFVVNAMASTKLSDPNKSIMVTKAVPTFVITLKSNHTTGFRWLLTGYDTNLIEPLSQKYYAPQNSMPGAGGYEEWNFKVKSLGFTVPQIIDINLVYARPWDLSGSKPITFKVVTK